MAACPATPQRARAAAPPRAPLPLLEVTDEELAGVIAGAVECCVGLLRGGGAARDVRTQCGLLIFVVGRLGSGGGGDGAAALRAFVRANCFDGGADVGAVPPPPPAVLVGGAAASAAAAAPCEAWLPAAVRRALPVPCLLALYRGVMFALAHELLVAEEAAAGALAPYPGDRPCLLTAMLPQARA